MTEKAKPAEPTSTATTEEPEVEMEDGIPCPPGYTSTPTDFSSPPGRRLIASRNEMLAKSITFTPLITSLSSFFTLLIMGGAIFMSINSLLAILRNACGAITTALAPNPRLGWANRMVMIAIGLGLFLVVVWRAQVMGLLAVDRDVQPIAQKTPTLFRVNP